MSLKVTGYLSLGSQYHIEWSRKHTHTHTLTERKRKREREGGKEGGRTEERRGERERGGEERVSVFYFLSRSESLREILGYGKGQVYSQDSRLL